MPNEHNKRLAGLRVEWGALREEILFRDRSCVTVIGFLFAFTAAVLAFALGEHGSPGYAVLISLAWFIAFRYIFENRFVIKRIAYYLRTEIEGDNVGFGWERWLREKGSKLRPFRRANPFYTEVALTSVVMVGVPILMGVEYDWPPSDWRPICRLLVAILIGMLGLYAAGMGIVHYVRLKSEEAQHEGAES